MDNDTTANGSTAKGYEAATRMRVRPVLEEAVEAIAAWKVAHQIGAPVAVKFHGEMVDRIWDGLRRLTPEDRILAIIMLLEPQADRLAANPRCEVAP